jgi:hypothetical protein
MLDAKLSQPNLILCYTPNTQQNVIRSRGLVAGLSPLGCLCSRIISVICCAFGPGGSADDIGGVVPVSFWCWELLAPKGNRHLENSAKLALITPAFPVCLQYCPEFPGWPLQNQNKTTRARWCGHHQKVTLFALPVSCAVP